MSYFSCSALYKAIYPRSSVRMRTAFKCVLDMFFANAFYIVIGNHSIFGFEQCFFTSSNWVLQIIASIFLLLYLYFVYNVIFYLLKTNTLLLSLSGYALYD